ncbi:PEP-CTERM sorting domain-containing protein [Roseateles saccharophilus]|uniref:PEP-CTERM sorting domain-containing protein n=1 Tax=Roseateles saccharophilus TaxID=304 RepID=UPI00286C577E|nr:PEP-CTERM sorting domain-containing protein [Roseateles saccharophilus]
MTNGGFETGDFTGWSFVTDPLYDGVDTLVPHDGTYAAYFGGASSSITQTLTTVAGSNYKVSFWLMLEPDVTGASAPNAFSFDFGAATGMSLSNASAFGYTLYEVTFIAAGASTDLSFNFSQGPAFWDLDSVSVTLPEPGSLALLAAAGLGGLAASRRRRPASTSA